MFGVPGRRVDRLLQVHAAMHVTQEHLRDPLILTIAELERRGHSVETGPDWSEGRLTAASRVGPRRRAAANARGMQGYAAGR